MGARDLRALHRVHGPLPCRRLAALAPGRADLGGGDARHRRPPAHAALLALPAFRETSDDDWLKKSDLAVTFLDRYGNEVGNRGIKHNDSVPLEDMPDHLIKATLATEDRRFYEHFGIDFYGTFRALMTNAKAGGVVQGGSTITQQLAKNLFLSNERTIERKINEAFLALWLETRLSKNEILKLYLDRAYLGGGAFGVDAAAQYYFGKSVRDVTLPKRRCSPACSRRRASSRRSSNLPAARARANVVLDNLVDNGFMTEGQVYGARRNPATPIDRTDEDAPNYYLDWAFDEMRKLVDTFPKSVNERFFVVRTALDSNLQRYAEHAIEIDVAPVRPRLWRKPVGDRDRGSRRRACAPWSAAAITAKASSTARSTRCASPDPRSSPTCMRPRWPTDSSRARWSSTRRSASATGARTTIRAAIPGR